MKFLRTFESYIKKDDNPNNLTYWHGGNLDDMIDVKGNKSGRNLYGNGLYLSKAYSDVQRYKKGGRKLYKVVVEKGTDIKDVKLNIDDVLLFVKDNVIKNKQKKIIEFLENNIENDKIYADTFNNILLNEKALQRSNQINLIYFFIDNGIDYEITKPAFFMKDIMVLYNTSKIVSITRVSSKDEIVDFNF